MTISMYMAYLVAEELRRKLLALDVRPRFAIKINLERPRREPDTLYDIASYESHPVEIAISGQVPTERDFLPDEADKERFASAWLEKHPETRVIRNDGFIYLIGITSIGVSWEISLGYGLCEQVQVGTKVVEKIDPAYLENAPMIKVEEPVYETRCVDPLAETVSS